MAGASLLSRADILVECLKVFLAEVAQTETVVQLDDLPGVGEDPVDRWADCAPGEAYQQLAVGLDKHLPKLVNVDHPLLRVDDLHGSAEAEQGDAKVPLNLLLNQTAEELPGMVCGELDKRIPSNHVAWVSDVDRQVLVKKLLHLKPGAAVVI